MKQYMTRNEDRRQHRSQEPEEAIAYQVEHVVCDFDLECCLIVDSDGNRIAASSKAEGSKTEALARLLPLICAVEGPHRGHLERLRKAGWDVEIDEITSCVFRAGGRRHFIGAIGSEAVMNEVAIMRAITGARRIHSE